MRMRRSLAGGANTWIRPSPANRLDVLEPVGDWDYVEPELIEAPVGLVYAASVTSSSPAREESPELALDAGVDHYLARRAELDRRAYERRLERAAERRRERTAFELELEEADELEVQARARARLVARRRVRSLEARLAAVRAWLDPLLERNRRAREHSLQIEARRRRDAAERAAILREAERDRRARALACSVILRGVAPGAYTPTPRYPRPVDPYAVAVRVVRQLEGVA